MSANFLQGFLGTQQAGIEARNDITVAVRNWFANRNPLVTRLPYVPVERVDFLMYIHQYRNRSTTLGDLDLGVDDDRAHARRLDVPDESRRSRARRLERDDRAGPDQRRPDVEPNVTVLRGVAGTTATTSLTTATVVNLIGNSRNGAEVNQTGLTTIGVSRTQYCQTFQFPVQIGGSAQTARAQVMPGGIQSPFDFNMTIQLQNMVDDIENTCYYGISQAPNDSAGTTAKMNGLKYILQSNNTTSPTNLSAYGSTDLIRDTLQAARSGGGEPDLLVVSTNFMSGFATWGQAVQRIPAGETVFGTPINVLEAPFLHGVTIVEAPLLRPYTAIALTSSEVYIRNKRNPYWNLRGNRGDMVEGDWIAELAIEVVNESPSRLGGRHHRIFR